MKFSMKGFFSKCDRARSFLLIWLHLLKKSLMGEFIFCVVKLTILQLQNLNTYLKNVSKNLHKFMHCI